MGTLNRPLNSARSLAIYKYLACRIKSLSELRTLEGIRFFAPTRVGNRSGRPDAPIRLRSRFPVASQVRGLRSTSLKTCSGLGLVSSPSNLDPTVASQGFTRE